MLCKSKPNLWQVFCFPCYVFCYVWLLYFKRSPAPGIFEKKLEESAFYKKQGPIETTFSCFSSKIARGTLKWEVLKKIPFSFVFFPPPHSSSVSITQRSTLGLYTVLMLPDRHVETEWVHLNLVPVHTCRNFLSSLLVKFLVIKLVDQTELLTWMLSAYWYLAMKLRV